MKNITEWSVEFDLFYNNLMSNQAPGLNEYEKSAFLTRAEENVVLQLYNGSARESFEGSEEITKYLSQLVKQANGVLDTDSDRIHIVSDSKVFRLPSDLLFRIFENCTITIDAEQSITASVVVIPVTHDEFWRTRRDPFKWDGKTRVLRLTYSENYVNSVTGFSDKEYSELISKYPIESYTVRYLSKPSPIILTDLSGTGLSINGETTPQACTLPEVLHHTILTEAVRLAKSAWSSNN